MGVLKLRAVDLDYRAGIPEQNFGGGFDDAGLPRPGGTQKEQIAHWASRRVQTGTENLVEVDHGLKCFVLPDDLAVESCFKIARFQAALGWVEFLCFRRHGSPRRCRL